MTKQATISPVARRMCICSTAGKVATSEPAADPNTPMKEMAASAALQSRLAQLAAINGCSAGRH